MMTHPNLGRKKKKITYIASPQGVERAEKALIRLGFESKINFAKSQLLSRSTVTKFFQHKPIQLDSFKRISEALKLNWVEIAGIIEEERSERLEINNCSSPDTNEEAEPVQTLRRIVTVTDKQSQTIIAAITLKGDIHSVQNWKILQSVLREYSGNTIKITDIEEGSIRLIVEGSPEDIEQLLSCIKSGELKEVSGFPVEDAQIVGENSNDDESAAQDRKWRLVQEIVSLPIEGRDLSGADLSDADLSNADLSNADLSGADLSDADLSDADLSGANLRSANLSDANLSRANLSRATLLCTDLSHANLSRANLSGVNLSGVNLSHADLSDANLSNTKVIVSTDLSDAVLSDANLSNADLSDADLSRADLSDADLSNADLSLAKVEEAQFGRNTGLTEALKIDLQKRGAFFEDSPGDRSLVSSRRST